MNRSSNCYQRNTQRTRLLHKNFLAVHFLTAIQPVSCIRPRKKVAPKLYLRKKTGSRKCMKSSVTLTPNLRLYTSTFSPRCGKAEVSRQQGNAGENVFPWSRATWKNDGPRDASSRRAWIQAVDSHLSPREFSSACRSANRALDLVYSPYTITFIFQESRIVIQHYSVANSKGLRSRLSSTSSSFPLRVNETWIRITRESVLLLELGFSTTKKSSARGWRFT